MSDEERMELEEEAVPEIRSWEHGKELLGADAARAGLTLDDLAEEWDTFCDFYAISPVFRKVLRFIDRPDVPPDPKEEEDAKARMTWEGCPR